MKIGTAVVPSSFSEAPPALRDLAVAVEADRRRTPSGGAAREVLDLWWGLVEGRWRLVERFEANGRRYYVARESPSASAPKSPDVRERDLLALLAAGRSEKFAAQELGVSASTISALLKLTLSRSGMASLIELVQLLRVVGPFA
ncbi:MAG TPA: LuxR C-terminal-related transcriptional regulator [Polyangiaceae bacterium]|nr:LuxR C-terminal-related transcriptional regulator [Polyangiaceae bacterium]